MSEVDANFKHVLRDKMLDSVVFSYVINSSAITATYIV